MSQAVGRMYHPAAPLRRAGDVPHIHPANAHRYHNNYNNGVQVYTVTTRSGSPGPNPHHRPASYHSGGGYGPPPSPPLHHHNNRGRRGGRYPPNPNSYYNNSPTQTYQNPQYHKGQPPPPQQAYRHPHNNHLQQQQQHVQQQPPPQLKKQLHHHPLQRRSSSPLPQRNSSPAPSQRQSPVTAHRQSSHLPPPVTSQSLHHNGYNNYNGYHYPNQNQGSGYPQNQQGQQGGYPQQRLPRNSSTGSFLDELEWDSSDGVGQLGADKKGKAKGRADRDSSWRKGENGLNAPESDFVDLDFEWDDYDLRPKIEETDDGVELVLPENYLPLLKASQKATLSKGQVPLNAIQVRRLPNRTYLSAKTLGFNKDLLVLTTDFQGLGDPGNETKELLEDALVGDHGDIHLLSQNNNGPDIYKLPNGYTIRDIPSQFEGSVTDSDSIRDRSGDLEDSDEQSTNDFLEDDYELPCHDRLADVADLYALSPHDLYTPDSICSRSIADLTDLSLYEEFGVETIRRRRALLGADKGGRDSLLKEATRKLSLKAKKRKRKSTDGSILGALDDGSDKQKRVAPNYFVAIQVSNPEIHKALQDVQQTVMAGDEKLKDAMVPISTLHLTIMVMHLANDEDVERAKLALMECHHLLGPQLCDRKMNIWFHGLGHFNNQVMFAKIKDVDGIIDKLYNIAETVENCYRRHGIHSTGERGFKPHLTVMKLSRAPSLRKKGVRRIKSELYRAHSAMLFGGQEVGGFQLCSINKPKSEEGYYYKAHEIRFGEAPPLMADLGRFSTIDVAPKEPITELDTSSASISMNEASKQPMTELDTSAISISIDEAPKEPITELVTSAISISIEEEPKEPITELESSGTGQSEGESSNQQQEAPVDEAPKEPITELDSSGTGQPDVEPANQQLESQEAKDTNANTSSESSRTSINSNTEGSRSTDVEPT